MFHILSLTFQIASVGRLFLPLLELETKQTSESKLNLNQISFNAIDLLAVSGNLSMNKLIWMWWWKPTVPALGRQMQADPNLRPA